LFLAQEAMLAKMITALERDTGFKLRLLAQVRAAVPLSSFFLYLIYNYNMSLNG
jgi:hypothetical protein